MEYLSALNNGFSFANTVLSSLNSENMNVSDYERLYDDLLVDRLVEFALGPSDVIRLVIENVMLSKDESSVIAQFSLEGDIPSIDLFTVQDELALIEGMFGEPGFVSEYELYHPGPYSWGVWAYIDSSTVGPIKLAHQTIAARMAWAFGDFHMELRRAFNSIDTESRGDLDNLAQMIIDKIDTEDYPYNIGHSNLMLWGYVVHYICMRKGIEPPEYLATDMEEIAEELEID